MPSDATVEIVLRDGFDTSTYEYYRYILDGVAGAQDNNKFTMPRTDATLKVEIVKNPTDESAASAEVAGGIDLGA